MWDVHTKPTAAAEMRWPVVNGDEHNHRSAAHRRIERVAVTRAQATHAASGIIRKPFGTCANAGNAVEVNTPFIPLRTVEALHNGPLRQHAECYIRLLQDQGYTANTIGSRVDQYCGRIRRWAVYREPGRS